MWITKGSVRCPVCQAILGKLVSGRPTAYPCNDCGWIFPFDEGGKGLEPIKINKKKSQKCTCEGCKARDDKAFNKSLENL